MRCKAAIIFSLVAATASVYAAEKPCTVHDNEKGKFFDLTALKSSKDYHVTGAHSDIFPINACQGTHTETFGIKDDTIRDDEIAAFVRRKHGDFVIGKLNTTLTVVNHRPRMVFSDGSKCKTSQGETTDIRASTVVDFVCNPAIFGPGQPKLVAQLPPGDEEEACAFVIEWETHYACPIGEGGFIWSLFVFLAVTFLTLLTLYTILGTLYNRYVLQLRGFDQIPQFSIESMKYHSSEALDWLKDVAGNLDIPGSNGSLHHSGGAGGAGGGRTPTTPWSARSGPRTPNPISHQAQVLGGGVQARGAYEDEDVEASAGFVRPGARTNPNPQNLATNPVSHQSQVIAEAQQRAAQAVGGPQQYQQPQPQQPQPQQVANLVSISSSSSSGGAPPTPPPKIQLGTPPVRTKLEVRPATQAEREFMLGEDEDDDYEDDDDDEDESDEEEDGQTTKKDTPGQSSSKPGQGHPPTNNKPV